MRHVLLRQINEEAEQWIMVGYNHLLSLNVCSYVVKFMYDVCLVVF